MPDGIVGIVIIVALVLMLNLLIVYRQIKRLNKRSGGRKRPVPSADKQAAWREKEVARRIEREQDDALERVKLREETLALYETVRKRHEKKDALTRLGLDASVSLDDLKSLGIDEYLSEE
ncbi:MAG: hypothetical protein LBC71_02080 [Oscillospiraceae bacterium]|nr:hypothetical protein [Oscillospiraceae bacterium]